MQEVHGVYYALPETAVISSATVEAIDSVEPKFPDWTEALFDLKPSVRTASRKVSVKSGSGFSTTGQPDLSEVYVVAVRGKWFEDRSLALKLDESGTLTQLDQSITDNRPDLAAAALKTALNYAALPGPGTLNGGLVDLQALFAGKEIVPLLGPKLEAGLRGTSASCCAEVLKALLPMIADREPTVQARVLRRVLKGTVASAFRGKPDEFAGVVAALVSIEELQLVKSRVQSEGSDAVLPSDRLATLDAISKRVDQALGTYYFGSRKKSTWAASLSAVPRPGTTSDLVLIDETKGVCEAPGGKSLEELGVPAGLRAMACRNSPLRLVVGSSPRGLDVAIPANASSRDLSRPHGLTYRIPGEVDVELVWRQALAPMKTTDTVVAADSILLAQAGSIHTLPTTAGGRTTTFNAQIHSATGALKNFVLNSTAAVSAANLTAVGDALVAKEKAEREQSDPLAQLIRERDFLKTLKEIEDLRKQLGAEEELPK